MLVEDLIARRPDIRLLTARDGNRGIEIARASLPDVILMDINLPGISGIEALKILAQDPATAHIPVDRAERQRDAARYREEAWTPVSSAISPSRSRSTSSWKRWTWRSKFARKRNRPRANRKETA